MVFIASTGSEGKHSSPVFTQESLQEREVLLNHKERQVGIVSLTNLLQKMTTAITVIAGTSQCLRLSAGKTLVA